MSRVCGLFLAILSVVLWQGTAPAASYCLISDEEMKSMKESVKGFDTVNKGAVDSKNQLTGMMGAAPAEPVAPAFPAPLIPPDVMEAILDDAKGYDVPLDPGTDTDGDGVDDTFNHYNEDGTLLETDYDTDNDGEIDKVVMNGVVVASDIDNDGDLDPDDYRAYLQKYLLELNKIKLAAAIADDGDPATTTPEEAKVGADAAKLSTDFENTFQVFHSLLWNYNLDTDENRDLADEIRSGLMDLMFDANIIA